MPVVKEKKTKCQVAAFCLFVGTSPIDFALLGGNRLKSKTTAKLKEK
jgi:hypothetical protein